MLTCILRRVRKKTWSAFCGRWSLHVSRLACTCTLGRHGERKSQSPIRKKKQIVYIFVRSYTQHSSRMTFTRSSISWIVRNLMIIRVCRKNITGFYLFIFFFYFFQPIRIRQRRVGKRVLPFHIVPRCSDVIVPRDHSFHGVPHQVYVNWFRQVESATKTVLTRRHCVWLFIKRGHDKHR